VTKKLEKTPRRATFLFASLSPWLRALALLLGLGLFAFAVVAVGHYTRTRIQDSDRYTVPFAEIDCTPPPNRDRADFLSEVQEQAGLPGRLQILDGNLASRLADAFAGHPCVEKVEQVAILPLRRIEVHLAFRVPVLEVMLPDKPKESSAGEASWIVDQNGIVLPRKGRREALPLFFASAQPTGQAGQPWGDPSVEAAARTAGYLKPHQARLNLKVFEMASGNLVLCTLAGTRVLWGQAPGAEPAGESPAEQKLERILHYCEDHGSLDRPAGRYEHDVRSPNQVTHRPLPVAERP
jgi:hypothetical protein